MMKRIAVLVFVVCMTITGLAQKEGKASSGGVVDRTYLQKIWDGWAALDASKQKQYYAQGPHVFFDIAPLKYASWDEYESGVKKELADYKSGKFTVNDDAQVHSAGNSYWATSTIKEDATLKNGKRELATWRWTVIFENQGGKWVIVHEHVSAPAQ